MSKSYEIIVNAYEWMNYWIFWRADGTNFIGWLLKP